MRRYESLWIKLSIQASWYFFPIWRGRLSLGLLWTKSVRLSYVSLPFKVHEKYRIRLNLSEGDNSPRSFPPVPISSSFLSSARDLSQRLIALSASPGDYTEILGESRLIPRSNSTVAFHGIENANTSPLWIFQTRVALWYYHENIWNCIFSRASIKLSGRDANRTLRFLYLFAKNNYLSRKMYW